MPCPRSFGCLALAGLFLSAPLTASGVDATAADLIREPNRFFGQVVTLRGTMANLQPAGHVAGPPFTSFDLLDGGALIKVLAPTPPACFSGSVVTVEGRFSPSKQVGKRIFLNVIEAFHVRCS